MKQYEGDAFWVDLVGQTFESDYKEAKQSFNSGTSVWFARTMSDIFLKGLHPIESLNHHRAELRSALGIPPKSSSRIPTPRLRVEGLNFIDALNHRWIMKSCTDFCLFSRWLRGETEYTINIVRDRRSLGFNCLRVFAEVPSWAEDLHLYPQEHQNYYIELVKFMDMLIVEGMYCELCVFTDESIIKEKQTHWNKINMAVSPCDNVLLEFSNERHVLAHGFTKFNGIVSSSGSGLGDDIPPEPYWDYCGFHPRRDEPKVWLSASDVLFSINGFDGFNGTHRATVVNEPIGAADFNEPGRRSNNSELFKAIGTGCSLYGAGGTFHSSDGILSLPFSPTQRDCAAAFSQGLSFGE